MHAKCIRLNRKFASETCTYTQMWMFGVGAVAAGHSSDGEAGVGDTNGYAAWWYVWCASV